LFKTVDIASRICILFSGAGYGREEGGSVTFNTYQR